MANRFQADFTAVGATENAISRAGKAKESTQRGASPALTTKTQPRMRQRHVGTMLGARRAQAGCY